MNNTSFLKKIAQPILETIENNGEEITFSIIQKHESEQTDMEKILILSETLEGTFKDFDEGDQFDWNVLEEIPLYKAQSEKLKLSGEKFSLITKIDEDGGFESGESYKLSLVTWGSNVFFKKAFNHNGWFFSKRSKEIDIYISKKNTKKLYNFHYIKENSDTTNHFGLTINGQDSTLETTCNTPIPQEKEDSTCTLVHSLENNENISSHLSMPCQQNSTVGLYPLRNHNNKNVMQKPAENDDGYLCDIDFPAEKGDSFMGKTSDAYFRIYVENIDTSQETKDIKANITIELSIFIYPSTEKKLTF